MHPEAKRPSSPFFDTYNPALLAQQLVETGFYRNILYVPTTHTTMDDVKTLALSGNPFPFAEITDHQTKGIGREGRVWHDRKNSSLMFSVFLPTSEDAIVETADMVALKTCIAIEETMGIPVKIKWPNDLVVNNKKLAGILPHPLYDENNIFLGLNLGVGINVHYGKRALQNIPADYSPTSLDMETHAFVFRPTIATKILQNIRYAGTYASMIKGNSYEREKYNTAWRNHSSLIDQPITITQGGKLMLQGIVVNTEIGNGLFVQTSKGIVNWNVFDAQTKVRLAA